jgi:glycosyltransferase involved in cell wall biosynthesis
MHSSDRLAISVVVPVYNGGEDFRRCIEALTRTKPAPDEVIVVVDGATDGSDQVADSFGVQVARTPTRSGPAQARNVGARSARGDVLFFVDADVLVRPDAVGQVRGIFERNPELAAIFGSYDDAPAGTNFLSQYKNLFHHYVHQTAREEASTFFGACGAIRRDIFLELGGYDRCYREPAIEDIELGYRLRQAGHRIRLCKTLQVKHLKRWGVQSLLRADFFQRALPWTELILRDHRFINDLNLRYSSRVSVLLVGGLLVALAGAWAWPALFLVAGGAALLLLVLNARLYRFFQQKRGLWFALRTIPWHWLYFLYSGLAFAIGLARYGLSALVPARSRSLEPRDGI